MTPKQIYDSIEEKRDKLIAKMTKKYEEIDELRKQIGELDVQSKAAYKVYLKSRKK